MAGSNKMYMINNIEKLKGDEIDSFLNEFEINTDSNIQGEFSYGPYKLMVWDFEDKKPGENKKLILQIEFSQKQQEEIKGNKTFATYFIEGGIPQEITILSSLFLRRRFILGPVVRWDGKPCLLSKKCNYIDRDIIENESNLEDLQEWFHMAVNLKDELHQRFMLASRFYHLALKLIEEYTDIAYVNLVSSIEALSFSYEVKELSSNNWEEGLPDFIQNIEDKELKFKLVKELSKYANATKKFVAFVMDHTEDSFWQDSKRPKTGRIEKKELEKYLKRIYNQRSNTLHKGEPFPPDIFDPPFSNCEAIKGNRTIGDKRWKNKEMILHPYFFEKLVNHVLKTYLKRNQK